MVLLLVGPADLWFDTIRGSYADPCCHRLIDDTGLLVCSLVTLTVSLCVSNSISSVETLLRVTDCTRQPLQLYVTRWRYLVNTVFVHISRDAVF